MKIVLFSFILLSVMCCKKTIKPLVINVPVQSSIDSTEMISFWHTEEVKTISDTFYFEFDKDELTYEEAARLMKFSLEIPEGQVVYVTGGCCPIGTEEYNLNLGWRRAKYGQYFVNMMVPNEVLIYNHGESNLVSVRDLRKNRRIEVETRKN